MMQTSLRHKPHPTTRYCKRKTSEIRRSSALRTSGRGFTCSRGRLRSEHTFDICNHCTGPLTALHSQRKIERSRRVQREAYARRDDGGCADGCIWTARTSRSDTHNKRRHCVRPVPGPGAKDGRELCRPVKEALLRRDHLSPCHSQICKSILAPRSV